MVLLRGEHVKTLPSESPLQRKFHQAEVSHVGTGVRSILSLPWLYMLHQKVWGGDILLRLYVRGFLHPIKNWTRILEIGCGPARILQHLPAKIEYVGYDMNPRYIEYARERHTGRKTFYCQHIGEDTLRPPSNYFDVVLATGVLHHLTDQDSKSLIDSAYDCLRPGGFLLTLDPVICKKRSLFERIVMPMDRGQAILSFDHYVSLAKTRFETVHGYVRDDLVRVPFGLIQTRYNHLIMNCSRVPGCEKR